eukprot:CAMPEP_0114985264 /NCGR_PEP_ID=MMETSP0216-20121206/7753_1 /TAXON_ID=223996 /ORGANISM="Protocruzia adherens, Strain Boccale" /LENGTH=354 /DNA_ID=CAMNT_0002347527 /DNA_START=44 /DNA_END=1108 /DNA_ORIENTATION=+
MVYWNSTDIIGATIGGVLIALAASINLYFNGKITGISGIFHSILKLDQKSGLQWKLAFAAGLFLMPYLSTLTDNISTTLGDNTLTFYDSQTSFSAGLSYAGYGISGLLVGFGVKMGNGCTSGHGVCGLARLSKRSVVAVGVFMGTAMLMANFREHVHFLEYNYTASDAVYKYYGWFADGLFIVSQIAGVMSIVKGFAKEDKAEKLQGVFAYLAGLLFGLGLLFSGMLKRSKIVNFLTFSQGWDPSLAFVMAGAVLVNLITFHLIKKKGKTAFNESLDLPTNNIIDPFLIAGAAVFGLGWGFGGLCPGPALVDLFSFYQIIFWLPFYIVGQFVADPVKNYIMVRMAAGAYSKIVD